MSRKTLVPINVLTSASAPSTPTLKAGDTYFNTSDGKLYTYTGSAWVADPSLSSSNPVALGTAAPGSGTSASRDDHVHPTTGLALLASANTFTAAQSVVLSTDVTGLLVKGSATQSATLQEWQNSAATVLARITSAGGAYFASAVGVGTTSPTAYVSEGLAVASANSFQPAVGVVNTTNNNGAAALSLVKNRAGGAVTSGDNLGFVGFRGLDGAAYQNAAIITGAVDGTVSSGVVPGRLVFNTASSAGVSTERLRIDSAGQVGIGAAASTGTTLALRRTLSGAVNAYGAYADASIASDVTSAARIFASYASTAASNFTISSVIHYHANAATTFANVTAGGAVTNQYGFYVAGTLTGASNNYAFLSDVAAGTNRWNAFMSGTAANYFAGQTTVGSTSLVLGSGSVAQQFGVVSTAASNVAEVIRGAASQTGNLTEWQNSGGTVLASISSAGAARFVSIDGGSA